MTFLEVPDDWATETVQLDWQTYDPDRVLDRTYFDFDVLSINFQAGASDTRVSGEIQNIGDSDAERISIFVAGFDEDDNVIWVDEARPDRETLAAGETSTFSHPHGARSEPVLMETWVYAQVLDE
jgi:hypothetical protein